MSSPSKDKRYVASVAAFNEDGLLLFGKRKDDDSWCLPGGHFEPGEHPSQAAKRELYEETGLVPNDLEFIGSVDIKDIKVHVYSFKCKVTMEPDAGLDPDGEFTEFQWVNHKNIPDEILNNLHNKQDATLQHLGVQGKTLKSERSYWLCKDGLKIPRKESGQRLIWDEAYLGKVQEAFVSDGFKSEIHYVDISTLHGGNTPNYKHRVTLYKRMLAAGDELPPIVIRYDRHGLSLVDGNHRKEACIQAGITLTKALVVFDETELAKGVGLAALLGSALIGGGSNIPKQAPEPTVHSVSPGTGLKVWTPEGLHQDLHPIAHLESSWGMNLKHGTNPAGEFHTAHGALGFKPSTAHETYRQSPFMQKTFPGLNDPSDFMKKFKEDPRFYNLLASKHFAVLKGRHGSAEEAARAWRYGSTAVMNKDPKVMADEEGYVGKYKELAAGGKK